MKLKTNETALPAGAAAGALARTWTRSFTLRASVLLSAALLTACGGGSSGNSFVAQRVFAFGDEASVINADGSKYSINAVLADNVSLDCASNPIWIQAVASRYGLVFPQCNVAAVPAVAPASRIYAANGAKAGDVAAQIDGQVASGGFQANDLATVLAGSNDIVAQFAQYPGVPEATLSANLASAGTALALQVNRLADLGVKVLVSTAPDLGRAPYAGDRSAGSTNANPALLSRLSKAFNDALLVRLTNDGHRIGLIQLDAYVQAVDNARAAGSVTFVNTTLAACLSSAPLPTCTSQTLGTDAAAVPPPATPASASATTWLWADALRLSAGGQTGLGALATSRAQNNPF